MRGRLFDLQSCSPLDNLPWPTNEASQIDPYKGQSQLDGAAGLGPPDRVWQNYSFKRGMGAAPSVLSLIQMH